MSTDAKLAFTMLTVIAKVTPIEILVDKAIKELETYRDSGFAKEHEPSIHSMALQLKLTKLGKEESISDALKRADEMESIFKMHETFKNNSN